MRNGPTADADYTARLNQLQNVWWKRALDVQAPYRWNLRRLRLGRTLDIGCGIGRNLANLPPGSVGVDHNPYSVVVARARGLEAFVPDEFSGSSYAKVGTFDSLLLAHVVEHMPFSVAVELLKSYSPLIKPHGRVVLIAPQEAGFRSDATHVEWFDFDRLRECVTAAAMQPVRAYSFPFPRFVGRVFQYNEFVVIGKKA